MANLTYITENTHTEEANRVEGSHQRSGYIIGGLISILCFFINPILGLIALIIVFYRASNAGKTETLQLRSGAIGEESVLAVLKGLPDNYYIFNQIEVPNPKAKRGFNEIDITILGLNNIFIIEVKNHNGDISGHENEIEWEVYKIGQGGTAYWDTMYNPMRQVKNQAFALRNYFASKKIYIEIIPIVVFSNPECSYDITYESITAHVIGAENLNSFITNFEVTTDKQFENFDLALSELTSLKLGEKTQIHEEHYNNKNDASERKKQNKNILSQQIFKNIKIFAEKEWPNDMSLQRDEVDKQCKAIREIKKYNNKSLPKNIFRQIKFEAIKEWPNDFHMQVEHIEEHCQAFKEINIYRNPEVSKEVLRNIKLEASHDWPGDYKMQKFIIEEEINKQVR